MEHRRLRSVNWPAVSISSGSRIFALSSPVEYRNLGALCNPN